MPIVRMANSGKEIPAGAMNVQDVSDRWRPSVSEYWTPEKVAEFKLFTYETHNGLCIRDYERNGYDDSDFYMVVWNPELKKPESIEFASTRGWSYPCYGSAPDATPEVKAAYDAYMAEMEKARAAEKAEAEKMRPARGKTLKVVRGRKVPIGTLGTCIWVGDGRFGKRCGIKDAAGEVHWTALSNVEVAA